MSNRMMLKAKETVQFRSLLAHGKEYELLMFIAKVWNPYGSGEVVVRSVAQNMSVVLELNDLDQNAWFLRSIQDTFLQAYIHSAKANYIRFVIPLEKAGWIKHKGYDKVIAKEWEWLTISGRNVYRRRKPS